MKNTHLESKIINDILTIVKEAQNTALRSVNTFLVIRNWLIGQRIAKEVITTRSNDYGKKLIANLSKELSQYGEACSRRNLYWFYQFYKMYPNIMDTSRPQPLTKGIVYTACSQSLQKIFYASSKSSFLPWSFYRLLITIKNKEERDWYETQARTNNWSYRDLKRNIDTKTYDRTLSHQFNVNQSNEIIEINRLDYLKSLYIFDFVKLSNKQHKEIDLEKNLLANINKLILELGKGYSFIANQYHLRTNENDYYIDLVFYNKVLRCYLLIDLKIGKINHKDIGQMLTYLDIFDKQVKAKEDNPSIGMILSSDINTDLVKYLTLNDENNIVSSKYLTYLPTKQQLKNEIQKNKNLLSLQKTT